MVVEKLTILHISDLHRSSDNSISNVSLLSSLCRDSDNYYNDKILKPDLIIVSGDIAQGSNDFENADKILIEQYKEAHDFLVSLADELLNGDRNKIILVPGNHDICWKESILSMKKIDENKFLDNNQEVKNYYLKEINKSNSNIRWSWKDRSFYAIEDNNMYYNRLSYFANFYKEFYNNQKEYSLNPKDQYDIFDFEEWGITVIGLNSCYNNDHLNRTGTISPDSIGNISLNLRHLSKEKRLILAAWHHNINGSPHRQDYMDNYIIQNFIAYDIKIGFHGHQHKSEIIRAENNIVENKKMIILSAGSICAGPNELPSGYKQQYNILELIRINDNEIELKINSREKTPESSFENPIWQKGLINSLEPYVKLKLEHEKKIVNELEILGKAEKLYKENEIEEAIKLLDNLDKNDPFVRKILIECYLKLDDKEEEIIKLFNNPKNSLEAVALINAVLEVNNKEYIKNAYKNDYINKSEDPIIKELKKLLEVKI